MLGQDIMKKIRSKSMVSNLSTSAMGSIQEHPGALGAAALRLSLGISTSLRFIRKWSNRVGVDAKSRREKAQLKLAERHARRLTLEQDSLKRSESQQESLRAFRVRLECLACPDKEDCPRHGPYVQHFNNIPLNSINPVGSPFIDYSVPCSAATRTEMRHKKSSPTQDVTSLSNGTSALQALSDAIAGGSSSSAVPPLSEAITGSSSSRSSSAVHPLSHAIAGGSSSSSSAVAPLSDAITGGSSSSSPPEAQDLSPPPMKNPRVHTSLPQPFHTRACASAGANFETNLAAPPGSPVKAPVPTLPCTADSAIDLVAMLEDRDCTSSDVCSDCMDQAIAAAARVNSSPMQLLTPRKVQQQSNSVTVSNNLTPRSTATVVSIITTATNAEAAAAAVVAATSAQQAAQRVQCIAADVLPAHIAPAVLGKAEARMTANVANRAIRELRFKSVLDNFARSSPEPQVPSEYTPTSEVCDCADCRNADSGRTGRTGRNPSARAVLPMSPSAHTQHHQSASIDVQPIKTYATLARPIPGPLRKSLASSRQDTSKTAPSNSSGGSYLNCKPASAEMTAGAAAMYSTRAASLNEALRHTAAHQDRAEPPTAPVPATPNHLDAGKKLNADRLDSWIAELVDNMVCSNMLSSDDCSEVMKRILSSSDPNQKPWQHFKQAAAVQETITGLKLRR